MRASRKKRGKAIARARARAFALYPVDIGDCVFCQGSKVPRLYPHRCALTFNRTLIDCGIYFFSRISPVSARHHCPPPSCSHRAHSVPLSFSLPLVSLSLARSAPRRCHPVCVLCIPNAGSLYPESPRPDRPVSHSHFVSVSPTAVQIGEIKPRDGAARRCGYQEIAF